MLPLVYSTIRTFIISNSQNATSNWKQNHLPNRRPVSSSSQHEPFFQKTWPKSISASLRISDVQLLQPLVYYISLLSECQQGFFNQSCKDLGAQLGQWQQNTVSLTSSTRIIFVGRSNWVDSTIKPVEFWLLLFYMYGHVYGDMYGHSPY